MTAHELDNATLIMNSAKSLVWNILRSQSTAQWFPVLLVATVAVSLSL